MGRNTDQDNKKSADSATESINESRRALLRNAGWVGAAVAGSATAGRGLSAAEPEAAAGTAEGGRIPVREARENLTALEAETLEAITARIIPSDDNGPGAREARAVHYIDRALGAHHAADRPAYTAGLNALHDYAMNAHGRAFANLGAERQDAILTAMEADEFDGFLPGAGAFFRMLRDHTIEGCFSDPYYGGNRNFVGWDLLRYPGVRLGTTADEVAQGSALPPSRLSAYDHATFTKNGRSGR